MSNHCRYLVMTTWFGAQNIYSSVDSGLMREEEDAGLLQVVTSIHYGNLYWIERTDVY